MRDFNCHLGFLGYQEENENGRMIMEFIDGNNLILLNSDEKCQGTFRSVVFTLGGEGTKRMPWV